MFNIIVLVLGYSAVALGGYLLGRRDHGRSRNT